ncbi:helix-turn-helix domain-containing protein [Pseudomonas kielensis]|uniref:helix-turn-helix domain-containing protein n=1 Tax=Pseudomonas kielensis TaxID=2762577 RepID=UPI00223F6B38|nr:helix-turn-helix domain-containing protein [Pseudomonas kielensis]UZM16244.1 helix-turn-helix domain-containing protein [Pseudomonas kielensis]
MTSFSLPNDWSHPPRKSSNVLREIIKQHGTDCHLPANSKISGDEFSQHVFAVETGEWLIRIDSAGVIGHLSKGSIFGVSNVIYDSGQQIYLDAIERSSYKKCPIEVFKEVFLREHNVAIAIADHFAWLNRMTEFYLTLMRQGGAYAKVKFSIEWLSKAPSIYRENISLITFICDRTGVSKAHAHTILKQLKLGGYLEIESGFLLSVCKPLPNGY